MSRLGSDGELKYIVASRKSAIYILSCIFECQAPVEGKYYEYSEGPREGPNQHIFLTGPKLNREQYTVEVALTAIPPSETLKLLEECEARDRFADEVSCGKWISRKFAVERQPCPDAEATSACNSFQQLVNANDRDVMDDFAHQDHVYACFLHGKDDFFEVTFSDPSWGGFRPPDSEQRKNGIPMDAIVAIGGSEFAYYKNGVGDTDMSLHDIGQWVYFPLPGSADRRSVPRGAPSNLAQFKGKNIEIENDRWVLTETYKNKADSSTRHTVALQLATGRFTESFEVVETGQEIRETSGRCLQVPSIFF